MTDRVGLRGLRVDCVIGVLPDERTRTQPLVVDVALVLDVRDAAAGDDLAATIDYAALADAVREVLVEGRFLLVETAAERVAARSLAFGAPRARAVRVRVEKPDALGGAATPWVEIERAAGA